MLYIFSLSILGILILLVLYKTLVLSRGAFLKVQSISAFTTLSILFLSVYMYLIEKPQFIDLSFIYIIINYVGMVAIIKFVVFTFKIKSQNNNNSLSKRR